MFKKILSSLFVTVLLMQTAAACELEVLPSNKPASICARSYIDMAPGSCMSKETSNEFTTYSMAVYQGNCSEAKATLGTPSGYTLGYCQTNYTADNPDTDENEASVRLYYYMKSPLACPSGYSLNSGMCRLDGECPVEVVDPTSEMCSDGYPASASEGFDDAYLCDRSDLKQCTDGSYVYADVGICPTVCSDYSSCNDYAVADSGCGSSSLLNFSYTDPLNFSYSCGEIDSSSPDHPDNGGNADGNEYNDPLTPESDSVESSNGGTVDPQTLADYIDESLEDNFSNIEHSVRDLLDQTKTNTQSINDKIQALEETNSIGFDDVSDAVFDSQNAVDGTLSEILNSINASSEYLGERIDAAGVAASGSSVGSISTECVPTEANNYCENPHNLTGDFISNLLTTIEDQFTSDTDASLDVVKNEITSLEDASPLSADVTTGVFDYFTSWIPQSTECIPLVFGDNSSPFSFTITCDFSEKFKSIFGFLISIYTILQLVQILMSGITPKPKLN